jgi:hypothetical protein
VASELEHIGGLYCENRRLLDEYGKLLALLQQVKDGDVKPEQLIIDMDNLSWSLAMTGAQFAEAIGAKSD